MPHTKDPKRKVFELLNQIIEDMPANCQLMEVKVGLHWTGVTLKVSDQLRCGLASTVAGSHAHGEADNVGPAGELMSMSPNQLAGLVHSHRPTERAIGLAAINAALSQPGPAWSQADALEVLKSKGADKTVGLIGHFPFIPQLRPATRRLFVLEKDPVPGELAADSAPEILPQCDVVAITSMTILNDSLAELLPLLPADGFTMLLGPSTPMSPRLFNLGIDMLAGTYVERVEGVMEALGQGANYRQLHQIGTRLITMESDDQNTA